MHKHELALKERTEALNISHQAEIGAQALRIEAAALAVKANAALADRADKDEFVRLMEASTHLYTQANELTKINNLAWAKASTNFTNKIKEIYLAENKLSDDIHEKLHVHINEDGSLTVSQKLDKVF